MLLESTLMFFLKLGMIPEVKNVGGEGDENQGKDLREDGPGHEFSSNPDITVVNLKYEY